MPFRREQHNSETRYWRHASPEVVANQFPPSFPHSPAGAGPMASADVVAVLPLCGTPPVQGCATPCIADGTIDVVEAERKSIVKRAEQHRCASLLAAFPTDLLAYEILGRAPSQARILTLSLVCKRWRIAALRTITALCFRTGAHELVLLRFEHLVDLELNAACSLASVPTGLTRLAVVEHQDAKFLEQVYASYFPKLASLEVFVPAENSAPLSGFVARHASQLASLRFTGFGGVDLHGVSFSRLRTLFADQSESSSSFWKWAASLLGTQVIIQTPTEFPDSRPADLRDINVRDLPYMNGVLLPNLCGLQSTPLHEWCDIPHEFWQCIVRLAVRKQPWPEEDLFPALTHLSIQTDEWEKMPTYTSLTTVTLHPFHQVGCNALATNTLRVVCRCPSLRNLELFFGSDHVSPEEIIGVDKIITLTKDYDNLSVNIIITKGLIQPDLQPLLNEAIQRGRRGGWRKVRLVRDTPLV